MRDHPSFKTTPLRFGGDLKCTLLYIYSDSCYTNVQQCASSVTCVKNCQLCDVHLLAEFENAETLLISEVQMLLEHR